MSGSQNFGFLEQIDRKLVELSMAAELYAFSDPNTSLIKTRQFGERLATQWLYEAGGDPQAVKTFDELINQLAYLGMFGSEQSGHFKTIYHNLRKAGNKAAHEFSGTRSEAEAQLRSAYRLAVMFYRTIVDTTFKAQAFVPLRDPGSAPELQAKLSTLEAKFALNSKALQQYRAKLQEAEAQAAKFAKDSEEWQAFSQEIEDEFRSELAQKTAELEKAKASQPKSQSEIDRLVENALKIAGQIEFDEADTRQLIDAQLQEAGWQADSVNLTYGSGARPAKGVNQAIAEWPTSSGPADYVLFVGLQPIAVVEAKKQNKAVSSAIEQAKRYSRDYVVKANESLAAGPWDHYQIPFMFSTNGRPFIRQLRTESGIWFLDGRRPQNHSRPLEHWYTPEGLAKLLKQDIAAAQTKLATEPLDILPMRDYQKAAIRAVEEGLAQNEKRNFLLAMATGTGKTRTAIGLVYRLIKSQRFQRVLFVVDRTSLGEQATDAFKTLKLEQNQSFSEIYNIKELGDIEPESETRLHFATIQSLIRRLFFATDNDFLPVDSYDCIIVDEAHRGYNLDRELSDTEMSFRNEADYISKYVRVLDHFDAIKIALTATPALHTTEIFGAPIFEYSYRQAVLEGFLVDHEPPLLITTKLSKDGIHYQAGQQVLVLEAAKNKNEKATVAKHTLEDEVSFEIENFNRQVVTRSFNEVVCQLLVQHIDPSEPGKTLIFCATDRHADLVVDVLKEALKDQYGEVEDDAIVKITGAADKPLQLIRRYKNEQLPNIVATVDLLTTGIDVPRISNLVFLRRVRSRILYEQMLGRATRKCDEIGKEVFRIFDAVDIYSSLQKVTDMKPVVTQTKLTFTQLHAELKASTSMEAKALIIDQYVAKLQRKASKLSGKAKLGFENLAGAEPKEFVSQLRTQTTEAAVKNLVAKPALAKYLDKVSIAGRGKIIVSELPDELVSVSSDFGDGRSSEDFLQAFRQFLHDKKDEIEALKLVQVRPRELTRSHLVELRRILEEQEFSEGRLRKALKTAESANIVAEVMGLVRGQALGSPEISYHQRVAKASERILSKREWTPVQRKWLERIGKQLLREVVVDSEALNRGVFKSHGGFKRMNKIFDQKIEEVLGDLNEEIWSETG